MSQTGLGNAVGLTFQQIQKYERGANRIGSSRLYEFATVLDVPVSYFFEDMPSNAMTIPPISGRSHKTAARAGGPPEPEPDPLMKRETLELVRAYYKIRHKGVRKRIFDLLKAMSAGERAAGALASNAVSGTAAADRPCSVTTSYTLYTVYR